jgi:hypothetical protein
MLKIAIDSKPLSESLIDTYDYSGLQVFGLTQTTLGDLIDQGFSTISESEAIFQIPSSLTWEDGSRVFACQYENGIKYLIKSNLFFGKLLFRNIETIHSSFNTLSIKFKSKHLFLDDLMRVPNLVPISESTNQFSGNYFLKPLNDGYLLLPRTGEKKIFFKMIKTPEDNLKAFEEESIDITADTAFPFKQSATHRVSTGLNFTLQFGKKIQGIESKRLRICIKKALNSQDYSSVFYDYSDHHYLEGQNFSLAYDNFYPNYDLAVLIKNKLEAMGAKVKIIEDDYYKPSALFDLKVSISRPLTNSKYIHYASKIMNPIVRFNTELFKKCFHQLVVLEQTGSMCSSLLNLIDQETPEIHLHSLPSLYLSRANQENPIYSALRIKNNESF